MTNFSNEATTEIININSLKDFVLRQVLYIDSHSLDVIVSELTYYLQKHSFNFNNLQVVYGGSSFNFIKDDIVIRFTDIGYGGYDTISEYVSHSSAILKPNFEKIIDVGKKYRILELKKLQVGNISEREMCAAYIQLRDDGYLLNDIKTRNFGRDENGNVLLLDYGELMYIKDKENDLDDEKSFKYKQYVERELQYHKNNCPVYNEVYEDVLLFRAEIKKIELAKRKRLEMKMKFVALLKQLRGRTLSLKRNKNNSLIVTVNSEDKQNNQK